jgi:spermidine synthase
VALMARLLEDGSNVLLLGCGGGALGGMLHRRGARVTVVDVNPLSFQLARLFFWMPCEIECVAGEMGAFLRTERRAFDAIGIDVGGPRFSYEAVLDRAAVAEVRRLARRRARVTVNISCESPDDPVPGRIAKLFAAEGFQVWAFAEHAPDGGELNTVLLASPFGEDPSELAALAGQEWSLARLAG